MSSHISGVPNPSPPLLHASLLVDILALVTCVASVTDDSCRYSELPHPYSCPSLDRARLQSPYVLICCTSTPARSPPTSTGLELMLWWPRPGRRGAMIQSVNLLSGVEMTQIKLAIHLFSISFHKSSFSALIKGFQWCSSATSSRVSFLLLKRRYCIGSC